MSPATMFPNTVIQTSEWTMVEDKLRELLPEVEQSEYATHMFEDPEFSPSTPQNMSVLYRE